jgi:hypothetical protein
MSVSPPETVGGNADATEAIVPAIIGGRLTYDGTEVGGEVWLPGVHLGFALDRRHIVLRSAERESKHKLPTRVTETYIGAIFQEHGVEDVTDLAGIAQRVNKALRSDRTFKRASVIKPRKVRFLYRPYIPLGLVTLLGGDGGLGKSTVVIGWVATVSTGGTFRGGWRSLSGDPANVLLMSAEDGAEEVLRPRLEAAGADLDRVVLKDFGLTDDFCLNDEGFAVIERQVMEHRPRLVVVDPVVSFMGDKVDMHRSNEVRPMMKKLSALGRDHSCAVVVVAHLNKNEAGSAGSRFAGSVDFRNSVRSAMLVGELADEQERGRAVFHDKANVGRLGPPLGYDIEGVDDVARVVWRETDLTKSEVFGGKKTGPLKRQVAADVIRAVLGMGPANSDAVKAIVTAALPGVSPKTLHSARTEVGVHIRKRADGHTDWEIMAAPASA